VHYLIIFYFNINLATMTPKTLVEKVSLGIRALLYFNIRLLVVIMLILDGIKDI